MKVTVITVVYNANRFLEKCILSVLGQQGVDFEYIVIDGGSQDGSLTILEKYQSHFSYFISEPDNGMYDALNKGIRQATGDIIGILNADDMFANPQVLAAVVEYFSSHDVDAIYGNLNYIEPESERVVRKWISRPFDRTNFNRGWMPAHPTFYMKREKFFEHGLYSLDYGSAADYEFMLRYLYTHQIKAGFLEKLMVNMRLGGMSNASFKHRKQAFLNDLKAVKLHKLPFPWSTIIWKKISKVSQYLT